MLFLQALIDLKMFEKADDNFIRAIELEPDSGNIYVHRGLVLPENCLVLPVVHSHISIILCSTNSLLYYQLGINVAAMGQ